MARNHVGSQVYFSLVDDFDIFHSHRNGTGIRRTHQAQGAGFEGHEHSIVLIAATETGRAALASQHADDLERDVADQYVLAQRTLAIGEQLFRCSCAQYRNRRVVIAVCTREEHTFSQRPVAQLRHRFRGGGDLQTVILALIADSEIALQLGHRANNVGYVSDDRIGILPRQRGR